MLSQSAGPNARGPAPDAAGRRDAGSGGQATALGSPEAGTGDGGLGRHWPRPAALCRDLLCLFPPTGLRGRSATCKGRTEACGECQRAGLRLFLCELRPLGTEPPDALSLNQRNPLPLGPEDLQRTCFFLPFAFIPARPNPLNPPF